MNANEKRSRLEDIKRVGRKLNIREYREAIQLCDDLGLDTAQSNFKQMLAWDIEQAKQNVKLGIPRVDIVK